MAVSGIVVVAFRGHEEDVAKKLATLAGVEVRGIGSRGIAAVMEARSVEALRTLSEEIAGWEEVLDLQLAYVDCREEGER
jgi:nitrate reductase NapAB chaperone NapD